jgi:hypothetical protein
VVATGLDDPLYLTAPAGDPRLFVVEQTGRIRIISAAGQLLATPFLDVSGKITLNCSEQGLLGLAFHPQYATNGLFYINYTRPGGQGTTVIERYSVSADADRANAGSAHQIISIPQARCNHNGGQLVFGPDGILWAFMGDSGGAGDPDGVAPDPTSLLGKILRLDVDGGDPYAAPQNNPFVGGPGRDEIWALGLRNPWRGSFDPSTGTLFVADVGQNEREEVNAVSATEPGLDYGWNRLEGTRCFASSPCDASGTVVPVIEYTHEDGCSITGGYLYRGAAIPAARGHYFYSDFCTGFLRSFRWAGGAVADPTEWTVPSLGSVTSFGLDSSGELYVIDGAGRVVRLTAS